MAAFYFKLPSFDFLVSWRLNFFKLDDEIKRSGAEDLALKGSLISDDKFIHGFLASLSVIIVSELGDKTFFIAAIMYDLYLYFIFV